MSKGDQIPGFDLSKITIPVVKTYNGIDISEVFNGPSLFEQAKEHETVFRYVYASRFKRACIVSRKFVSRLWRKLRWKLGTR